MPQLIPFKSTKKYNKYSSTTYAAPGGVQLPSWNRLGDSSLLTWNPPPVKIPAPGYVELNGDEEMTIEGDTPISDLTPESTLDILCHGWREKKDDPA